MPAQEATITTYSEFELTPIINAEASETTVGSYLKRGPHIVEQHRLVGEYTTHILLGECYMCKDGPQFQPKGSKAFSPPVLFQNQALTSDLRAQNIT